MSNTASRRRRAGRKKCRRCKTVFDAGDLYEAVCTRCRSHCNRCDREFTENTKPSGKGHHKETCKPCHAEGQNIDRNRDTRLVKTYGITLNEFTRILELQNGVCYICQKPSVGRMLSVDHKHVLKDKQQNPRDTRNRVRGLLCWQCNGAIAKFRDDSVRLRRAADYLEQWPAQEILKGQI